MLFKLGQSEAWNLLKVLFWCFFGSRSHFSFAWVTVINVSILNPKQLSETTERSSDPTSRARTLAGFDPGADVSVPQQYPVWSVHHTR